MGQETQGEGGNPENKNEMKRTQTPPKVKISPKMTNSRGNVITVGRWVIGGQTVGLRTPQQPQKDGKSGLKPTQTKNPKAPKKQTETHGQPVGEGQDPLQMTTSPTFSAPTPDSKPESSEE